MNKLNEKKSEALGAAPTSETGGGVVAQQHNESSSSGPVIEDSLPQLEKQKATSASSKSNKKANANSALYAKVKKKNHLNNKVRNYDYQLISTSSPDPSS